MIIYGLSTCDTCRKARKALPKFEFCDVRADGMPSEVLDAALKTFGAALVNTRSTTWRGLDEDTRRKPAIQLIKTYPALMKRPLIAVDKLLFLGWNSDIEAKVKAAV
ncbi:MAG: ArsC/Spx/MgsR family protein [Pseudomonadota bacterium]